MEVNGREVVYWDCDDQAEALYHKTRDDAVEAWLDLHAEQGEPLGEGEILVYGYARMIVPEPTEDDADALLEWFFESHWEEYQGEDRPDFSPRMTEAALEFMQTLQREFVTWACEVIHTETVDVAAWLAAHPQAPAEAQPTDGAG